MNLLMVNVILALIWTAAIGSFDLATLVAGFILGYIALWLTRPLYGEAGSRYLSRTPRAVVLLWVFLYELVVSSMRIVWDVITPGTRAKPAIIPVPLDAETDLEILTLANLVSLTPGTLSLDVSEDHKTLYVHAMFGDDPESIIADIKQDFERRVLEVLR